MYILKFPYFFYTQNLFALSVIAGLLFTFTSFFVFGFHIAGTSRFVLAYRSRVTSKREVELFLLQIGLCHLDADSITQRILGDISCRLPNCVET